MTGTVATSFSAFFRPSPPRGKMRSTTPSCVASSRSSSRPPPATSPIAAAGMPTEAIASGRDGAQDGVGAHRGGRAAQDDRVAGLQAQRRRVDRDVRPRLVDDGDDAERDADLADVQAVGEPPALDDLARPGRAAPRWRACRRRSRRAGRDRARGGRAAPALSPASRPATRSAALASRISPSRAMSASAIASSAASRVSVSSPARTREASRAARQTSATVCWASAMG